MRVTSRWTEEYRAGSPLANQQDPGNMEEFDSMLNTITIINLQSSDALSGQNSCIAHFKFIIVQ